MLRGNSLSSVLNTLREIDVQAINGDRDRSVVISCVGNATLMGLLRDLCFAAPVGPHSIPGPLPLEHLPSAGRDGLRLGDLVLLLVDGRRGATKEQLRLLQGLESSPMPYLEVVFYALPAEGPPAPHTLFLPDPAVPTAPAALAEALLQRLPAELHLAAAARLPALRAVYTRDLIGGTCFSNASYALVSGLPQQIPLLSLPFAAADILVLTKNQALMVYKLALAHGAPPDFQARLAELMPVVGGGFVWRQLARTLIGLIPLWGLVPKVAIAYAGTYVTGVLAERWYSSNELIAGERLKQLSEQALDYGREQARELIARLREQRQRGEPGGDPRRFFGRGRKSTEE
jgi:uncharacterized protein (DUF697 family)